MRTSLHESALAYGQSWSESAEGCFTVRSPGSGQPYAEVLHHGTKSAAAAADAAAEAFPVWSRTTVFERSAIMKGWLALIGQHREELARIIVSEVGKPITQARGEVDHASGYVEFYAAEILQSQGELLASPSSGKRLLVTHRPIGPVFGITPWNFPAAMVTRTIAPALAAGCPVVLKPAEQSPVTAMALAALWEQAGGPPGSLRVLTCDDPREAAEVLLADRRIRKVTFTGSQAVGQHIFRQAAATMKSLSMELGGHAPFLVFDDADVEVAVEEAVVAKTRCVGQSCVAPNRLYVHESLRKQFTEAYVERIRALEVGDPHEDATDIGPLVDQQGLDKVAGHVDDAVGKGASLLLGGSRLGGLYYQPTVLEDMTQDMRIMQEETFGPVAPVTTFRTDEEAIAQANGTPYGLAAYFCTRDLGRTFRLIEELDAGVIGVNDGVPGGGAHAPFTGHKESGVGAAGGRWGLYEYLVPRFASVKLPTGVAQ